MYLSVALCTFNGELFLKKQLDSIIYQNLKVNEIIICDDASNDNTSKILVEYQLKYPELIKVSFNKKSLGTIKNFEKAISLTKGDLIFLSDQDDVWEPFKTEAMVPFFEKNNDCKLLFSNGDLIDKNNVSLNSTLWEKWGFDKNLRDSWVDNRNSFNDLINNKNKITGATVCFHKALKTNIHPIEIPYGYWHDCWLGLHASAVKGLFFVEESLIKYRVHDKQQVGISSVVSKEILNKNNSFISKEAFYKKINMLYGTNLFTKPNDKIKKRNLRLKFISILIKLKLTVKKYLEN